MVEAGESAMLNAGTVWPSCKLREKSVDRDLVGEDVDLGTLQEFKP